MFTKIVEQIIKTKPFLLICDVNFKADEFLSPSC